MEQQISPQEFREHYKNLPPELQEFAVSEDTAQKIERISIRNNAQRHVSEIARLTGRVLVGILPPNRFISALSEHLEIDRQTATEIAQDINREIFFPVRESLKALYGITDQGLGAVGVRSEGFRGRERAVQQPEVKPSFEQPPRAQPGVEAQPTQEPERAFQEVEKEIETAEPGKPESSFGEAVAEAPATEPPENLPTSSAEPASGEDKYKEPIGPRDVENLPPETPKPAGGAKIEGNVIDLKEIDVE